MARAVVPIDAKLLRATADVRNAEEHPVTRTVEIARSEGELAHFLAPRPFVQRAIVGAQRAAVAVDVVADGARGELAVLEGARNPFAHQRIDAGSVARQDNASRCVAVARVEPSNRERMPSGRVPLQAVERKLRERRDEFRNHPRLPACLFGEIARTLIVNADVQMWHAVDEARERPAVAADSAADASKVEAVAFCGEFGRALGVDCYV